VVAVKSAFSLAASTQLAIAALDPVADADSVGGFEADHAHKVQHPRGSKT